MNMDKTISDFCQSLDNRALRQQFIKKIKQFNRYGMETIGDVWGAIYPIPLSSDNIKSFAMSTTSLKRFNKLNEKNTRIQQLAKALRLPSEKVRLFIDNCIN